MQNFRSLVDSGVINVADITALIGANESGKSSVLQALASISMDSSYQIFDLTELDGILKKYMDGELAAENIEIVWAKFSLSSDDTEKLKTIVPEKVGQQLHLEITKYYDEFYKLVLNGESYRIPSRHSILLAEETIKSAFKSLENKAEQHLAKSPNDQFKQNFTDAIKKTKKVSVDVITEEESHQLINDLEEVLKLGIDEPFKKDIKDALTTIKQSIKKFYPKSSLEISLYKYLLEHMPRTVYFKTYERLEDDVSIQELKEKPQLHKTFVNFLTLAEIKLETLEKYQDEKMTQVYLENGCGKATRLLREAWHQEVLDVELRHSAGRLMVFTKNSKAVETLLPPSSGSEGFQWYLGFYINFGAATNAEYKNAILLLDDPGVFLHPKGHKDLLALFEEYLKRDVTTIYSTHLPFLIPRQKLDRLRLIQKETVGRSQVTEKFYTASDKDILYPLRAALGITLADSLFVGENTIVAEGLSDRILLFGMLKEFEKRGLKHICDLENLEVLAGEGAHGAKNYAIMLQIENLPYVVVLDNDDEGRASKTEFIKDGIPEEKIVILPQGSNMNQNDFDIEDLFPTAIYAEAFYNVHGVAARMDKAEVQTKFSEGNEKVSNKAKGILKSAKVSYKLDKQAIAYEILRIVSLQTKLDKVITDNFGKLFDEIASSGLA